MTEMPIEMVLKIEEITGTDLSFVRDDSCCFDSYNTSFHVTYCGDYSVFCHNKHYYSFTTLKQFEKIFHEHWYRYYTLGERDFDIDVDSL